MTTLIADLARSFFNRTSLPFVAPSSSPFGGFSPGRQDYQGYARAFTRNEIVNAAIRLLATSAAEPQIIGRRWRRAKPTYQSMPLNSVLNADRELRHIYARNRTKHAGFQARIRNEALIRNGFVEELPSHPLVKILNNPNPYFTRAKHMRLLTMDRYIAGDCYTFKARGGFNQVAELWRLHPERVQIIPDRDNFIAGYAYTVGREAPVIFPAEDVIHDDEPNPLSDYYGLSPMAPIMSRVEIDEAMKGFLGDFFTGGGNTGPGAILTTKGALNDDAKAEIRAKLRRLFGNRGGMRETLVITANETSYQKLGLDRGLTDAVPKEINAMNESRLALPFGIPGSILGLLIGYESSSYANKRADWQTLWDITMAPMLGSFDDAFTLSLCPEFAGIDEVCFDLSDIRALQEDQDAMHDRVRKDVAASLMGWEEGRSAIGLDPDISEGIFMLPHNVRAVHVDDLGEDVAPAPLPTPEPVAPAAGGEDDGMGDMPMNLGAQMAIGVGVVTTKLQIDAPRRGRRSLSEDADARALWEKGERLRVQFPSITNGQIAARIGVSLATWKRYKGTFA